MYSVLQETLVLVKNNYEQYYVFNLESEPKISGYCDECPSGSWTGYTYGGKQICLKYIQNETKSGEAAAICEAQGGKLPLPKNSQENSFIFAHAKAWNAFAKRKEIKKIFV